MNRSYKENKIKRQVIVCVLMKWQEHLSKTSSPIKSRDLIYGVRHWWSLQSLINYTLWIPDPFFFFLSFFFLYDLAQGVSLTRWRMLSVSPPPSLSNGGVDGWWLRWGSTMKEEGRGQWRSRPPHLLIPPPTPPHLREKWKSQCPENKTPRGSWVRQRKGEREYKKKVLVWSSSSRSFSFHVRLRVGPRKKPAQEVSGARRDCTEERLQPEPEEERGERGREKREWVKWEREREWKGERKRAGLRSHSSQSRSSADRVQHLATGKKKNPLFFPFYAA